MSASSPPLAQSVDTSGLNDALLQIAKEVAEPAGLQLSAMPPTAILRALQRRQQQTGLRVPARYREYLHRTPAEKDHLLEELLVHESFFFRDSGAFAEMRRWCLEWLNENEGVLRILSAPCATGEEPYSISAMLWMAGIPAERYLVDAVDISAVALQYAEAGVYGLFSLRGLPKGKVPEFLQEEPEGLCVRPEVCARVRFRRLNLVETGNEGARALAGEGPYHLICSRNLLLYQTSAAKCRLVERLHNALAPNGRLVIGVADWCSELSLLFDPAGPAEAFSLKARHATAAVATHTRAASVPTEASALREEPAWEHADPSPSATQSALAKDAAIAAAHEASAEQVETLYRKAQRAWDGGHSEQAERLCRQALYLDGSHLLSLQLLRSIWAPRMPDRFRRALDLRIERHVRTGGHGEGVRL